MRETFDSAVRAGKYALAALGHDEEEIERIAAAFFEHDRHVLAELAAPWDPGLPLERNPAYMGKAREQNAPIEEALRGQAGAARRAAE